MKQIFIFFIIIFYSNLAFSCVCGQSKLIDRFQKSEFVAKVKLLKVKNIENDFEYQNAEIEILELYKGEKLKTIKIHAALNSSCSLYVPENSTWLIFAQMYNGVLSFGYCSGSKQIDRNLNSKEYPNAQKNYNESIERKLLVLKNLKKYNIQKSNEFDLKISYSKPCQNDFKSFEVNKEKIAIYEIDVNRDLSIKKVKALREFDNPKLSKEILTCLSENIKVDTKKIKQISKRTKIIIVYYYYPAEDKNQSFISDIDL